MCIPIIIIIIVHDCQYQYVDILIAVAVNYYSRLSNYTQTKVCKDKHNTKC